VATDAPRPLEQVLAELQLIGLPGPERTLDVVLILKGSRQLPCIGRGLGGPSSGVGPDDEGGIANQADAPKRHPRHLQVEDRLHEGPFDSADDGGDPLWQPCRGGRPHLLDVLGASGARGKRDVMQFAVAVRHEVGQITARQVVAVPDKVD
jgi:hypothetical protein